MRRLHPAVLLLLLATVAAIDVPCNGTGACPPGSSCVAGESNVAVQSCVVDSVCGGNLAGNCPRLPHAGPLVCAWSRQPPEACAFGNCQTYGEHAGIFKCMDMTRCDDLVGSGACSTGCAVQGKPCNGRGTCHSTGATNFACTCDHGWSGARCELAVSDACLLGQCGDHGRCTDGHCVCIDGYAGVQCKQAPATSATPTTDRPTPSTTATSTPTTSSTSTAPVPSTSGVDHPTSSTSPPTSNTPTQSTDPNDMQTTAPTKDGSTIKWNAGDHNRVDKTQPMPVAVMIVAIVAALIVIGMIIFGVYARKKKLRAANAEIERSTLQTQDSVMTEGGTTPRDQIQVL
ncbi:hypothetical protein SPRG_06891 [Saprolegnia parasitica CBS 223.65]|uniref:EGF-like domain-containing protein n=1 Tax=Saprolegnia parasitica (strain CBS 223.65) TaxID=695850 RepID=A0A067CM59_SAPPC|nr:hypothetical protein SPRG_06891 [Saprolegnia parasitica CBS 223.65]KDO27621.1 hypothetical protein SPRG_06891 [Saprolegnia parasitica CBS 223.65]|eukprot:XP_012201743.1 hypothetical protein SPRG_06891 [Saprolegnia parasitica CBS 223.65]